MTTTHYSDAQGNYIGGFADGAQPPEGAIERPAPPRADAVWGGSGWAVPQSPQPTVEEQRAQWSAAAVQLKIALDEIGRLDEVETIVAASSRRTQIAWENATNLRRLSPAIVDLTEGSNPPFTDEQLDDVFQLAMSIEI
jgi:hypothetical protein